MNKEKNKTITATSLELEGLEELSNEDLEKVSGGGAVAEETGCISLTSKALGFRLCNDAKIPKMVSDSPFPILSGPLVMSLSLEKSELSLE